MSTTQLTYPDINLAFVGAQNAIDVCKAYINALDESGSFYNNQYSYKLSDFINAEKNIPYLRTVHDDLKLFADNWSKKHKVKVDVVFRIKDWIGFNAKIRLYQSKGKGLNGIRDLFGFKLILKTNGPDTDKTHQLAYQLMNDVLTFFSFQKKCFLLNAEPKSGNPLDPTSEVAKEIFIYKKSEILPEYERHVKNYLLNPKEDGYQSLQGCILTHSDLSDFSFEVQVHTESTNKHAQALHQTYKDGRYANIKFNIDFNNIHMPDLEFDKDGTILCDKTGLFLSNFKFLYR